MSQLVLDRPRTVTPSLRPAAPAVLPVEVADPAGLDAPLTFRPRTEIALVLAAARADAVHLAFSSAVPTVEAMRALVRVLDEEIAAVGRDRSSVRVVVEIEVVPTIDAASARRKRSHLEHLDALAGLTWSPSATRIVSGPADVVAEAALLAASVGADAAVLVPLVSGPATDVLRDLARAAA